MATVKTIRAMNDFPFDFLLFLLGFFTLALFFSGAVAAMKRARRNRLTNALHDHLRR